MIGGYPPVEDLLGQRRAVVGLTGSSPIIVSEPAKPSRRRNAAAASPASEAPTITMRPPWRKASTRGSDNARRSPLRWHRRCRGRRRSRCGGAAGWRSGQPGWPAPGRPPPPAAPARAVLVRFGIVPQRLATAHAEHIRGEIGALPEPLAPREIDDKSHRPGPVVALCPAQASPSGSRILSPCPGQDAGKPSAPLPGKSALSLRLSRRRLNRGM